MLNVPLVQLIREFISESLDVFSYFRCMRVLVGGVYQIFVTKSRQTPKITIFLGEFEGARREPIFI